MTADELADNLQSQLGVNNPWSERIREQAKYIAQLECELEEVKDKNTELQFNIRMNEMKYLERIAELEQVLQSIANEKVELSHDKIKWQIQDHIRWANNVLTNDISEERVAKTEK